MTVRAAFAPHYGTNQVIAPAAASASITIGAGNRSLLIQNTGANIAYVRAYKVSDGAVSATTADLAIPSGKQLVISKPPDFDTLAHISATGTTLNVMSGEGGV